MAARPDKDRLAGLFSGGKSALSAALTAIELRRTAPETIALLDEAWANPKGVAVGFTGPPGVGKSSLIHKMISAWRLRGRTVGVLAVDPSSHLTGGALLGDRTRMKTDPEDEGIYLRSMAARDKLGGLSELAFPATVLMRAVFDVMMIETVGVGQSETDIAGVADLTVFCVQPGAGDSLQYMKAGIAEIPDCVAVTKSDLKTLAGRAVADVRGALGLSAADRSAIPVLSVSAQDETGIDALVDWIASESDKRRASSSLTQGRQAQALTWTRSSIREEFGRAGERLCDREIQSSIAKTPFADEARLLAGISLSAKKDG